MRPSATPVRSVKIVGACISLIGAPAFIAAAGVGVADTVSVAAFAFDSPEIVSDEVQIAKSYSACPCQMPPETNRSPSPITRDRMGRGSRSLGNLKDTCVASLQGRNRPVRELLDLLGVRSELFEIYDEVADFRVVLGASVRHFRSRNLGFPVPDVFSEGRLVPVQTGTPVRDGIVVAGVDSVERPITSYNTGPTSSWRSPRSDDSSCKLRKPLRHLRYRSQPQAPTVVERSRLRSAGQPPYGILGSNPALKGAIPPSSK